MGSWSLSAGRPWSVALFYPRDPDARFQFPSPVQAFTLSSLAFMTIFVNSLLSLFRSRLSTPEQAPAQPPQLYPLPPPPLYPPQLARDPGWRPDSWDDGTLQTPSRRRRLENGAAAKVS
jgi:hypothetical protein